MSDKEEFTPPLTWIRDAYADENYGTRSIDDSYAAFDRAITLVRAEAWSEGHSQALANIAWPEERKGNPYRSQEEES